MEFDLSPKFRQKFYESDGGSYCIWSASDLPLLSEAKVGAGNLMLEPRGLALPHYTDSSTIAFVLQGSGIVGISSPNSRKEKVVKLNEGDAILVASGFTSWWYNDGDSVKGISPTLIHENKDGWVIRWERGYPKWLVILGWALDPIFTWYQSRFSCVGLHPKLSTCKSPEGLHVRGSVKGISPTLIHENKDGWVIRWERGYPKWLVILGWALDPIFTDSTFSVVFLGEASKAHRPGIFSYFFLAGGNSAFSGFSTDTLSRAWNLDEDQVNKVIKSQSGQIIVKVKEGTDMPEPREVDKEGIVFKLRPAENSAQLGKGGIAALTRQSASLLEKMGLSAYFVKQDPTSLGFFVDSDAQVTYVVNGCGRVEMADMDGRRVLDAKLNAARCSSSPDSSPSPLVQKQKEWNASQSSLTQSMFFFLICILI